LLATDKNSQDQKFALRGWLEELMNGSNIFLKRCDATGADTMTEKVKGVTDKHRLGGVYGEAMGSPSI